MQERLGGNESLSGGRARLGDAEPGDTQVGEGEVLSMPHDVVASAEQDEVVDLVLTAVGASAEMMNVAESGRASAPLGGAAAVPGRDCPPLRVGDVVGGAEQADDVAGVVQHEPFDPGVTQHGLDLRTGLRPGPRCGRAVGPRVSIGLDREAVPGGEPIGSQAPH